MLSIQWGNVLAPMIIIWLLGAVIVWRVGRAHISATYVASFLIFAAVRAGITGHPILSEIAPITGPMYQRVIFFMITDPKTVPSGRGARIVFGALLGGACTNCHSQVHGSNDPSGVKLMR